MCFQCWNTVMKFVDMQYPMMHSKGVIYEEHYHLFTGLRLVAWHLWENTNTCCCCITQDPHLDARSWVQDPESKVLDPGIAIDEPGSWFHESTNWTTPTLPIDKHGPINRQLRLCQTKLDLSIDNTLHVARVPISSGPPAWMATPNPCNSPVRLSVCQLVGSMRNAWWIFAHPMASPTHPPPHQHATSSLTSSFSTLRAVFTGSYYPVGFITVHPIVFCMLNQPAAEGIMNIFMLLVVITACQVIWLLTLWWCPCGKSARRPTGNNIGR